MTRSDLTIDRLMLHLPNARAAVPARAGVERLLDQIDWQPPGLRSGEVWVIRRLTVPPLDDLDAGNRQWIAAVQTQLQALFRQSVRVERGAPVAAAANTASILFADRADWLALFTVEILTGRLWTRWYWESLLPELPARYSGAALAAVWSRYAQSLPAALAALPAADGQRAVALLSPPEISRVVRALHEQFALPADIFDVTSAPTPASTFLPEAPETTVLWQRWTPALQVPLSAQARYLYTLSHTLARAPAYARSAAFTRQAAAWLQTALAHERFALINSPASPDTRPYPSPAGRSPIDAPLLIPDDPLPAHAQAVPPAQTAENLEPQSAPLWDDEPGVFTAFGGVLFLINALSWLDLPEMHAEHVSGLGWVEAFARALLGDSPEDAIWEVLRQLDQQRDGLIGAGWQPGEFRLSRRTVRRYLYLDDSAWQAEIRAGRLRLALDNVLVADLPLAQEASAYDAVATAIRSYTDEPAPQWQSSPVLAPFEIPPSMQAFASSGTIWWLERVMPSLLHLLRRGLGDFSLSVDEIARRVLWHSGHVRATRTHVDLTLPLDAADITLRRAGLDRNPGWLPDFGYIVVFYFE